MKETGKSITLTDEQFWMVAGEALKYNAPYDVPDHPDMPESVDDWADFAYLAVEKKLWKIDIINTIVQYQVSNVPVMIDIRPDMTVCVLGGLDKNSEKAREVLQKINDQIAAGKVTFTDKDGKVIKMPKRAVDKKLKKRKAAKKARKRAR